MIKDKNKRNENVRLFFSRYSYKQHGQPRGDIKYSGMISNCPKFLLEGIQGKYLKGIKYITVWRQTAGYTTG